MISPNAILTNLNAIIWTDQCKRSLNAILWPGLCDQSKRDPDQSKRDPLAWLV